MTTLTETKRDAILALDKARLRVRAREGGGDYDPATAEEQLRQLDRLEKAERDERLKVDRR